MREKTIYYVDCSICKKEIMCEHKPYNEDDFICKECLKVLPEPQRKEFNCFVDYYRELDDWKDKTGKSISYDIDHFEKDLLDDYNVKGSKAEKCYSLAWEYGHSSGYREVISYFEDLVELIT